MGPIEPNIYMAFSKGRPDVDARLFLPHDVETFLDGIWRRFGEPKRNIEGVVHICRHLSSSEQTKRPRAPVRKPSVQHHKV